MTQQDYADIVKIVGREDRGKSLSWLFSALPIILLSIVFIVWCIAFILVIVLFPDNESSEFNDSQTLVSLSSPLMMFNDSLNARTVWGLF